MNVSFWLLDQHVTARVWIDAICIRRPSCRHPRFYDHGCMCDSYVSATPKVHCPKSSQHSETFDPLC
eukprot:4395559-Amphidinium_carterae.1